MDRKGFSSRPLREISTRPSLSSLPERKRWNTNSTCPRRLVELADEVPSISLPVGTHEAVEILPDDERAVRRKAVGPRNRRDAIGQLDNPPVACRDRIQVPDRAGRHTRPASDHGQSPALRERRRLEPETESAKVRGGPAFKRAPAARPHRFEEFRFRHAGAVVENPDRRDFRMRFRMQLDLPGSGGQRVVDDIGYGGVQRVTDVAQALNEDGCLGRDLLLPSGTSRRHVLSMAISGSCRAALAGCRGAETDTRVRRVSRRSWRSSTVESVRAI